MRSILFFKKGLGIFKFSSFGIIALGLITLGATPFGSTTSGLWIQQALAQETSVTQEVPTPPQQILHVYTYDSFASKWGAGPGIFKDFEALCSCRVKVTALDKAATIINRLKLEGKNTKADVVIGLDYSLMNKAHESKLFAPHKIELPKLELPMTWTDDTFVPFDYGYLAFVTKKGQVDKLPKSLMGLAKRQDISVIVEDPRTSLPGLGFLLWVNDKMDGNITPFWQRLSSHITTITPSWSQAYKLFLSGETDMVLSYTTSPAYHVYMEHNDQYQAVLFDAGHYVQIEMAGVLASSSQKALGRQFLSFLLSQKAQAHIPLKQWMYPVNLDHKKWPDVFKKIPIPKKGILPTGKENHGEIISQWLNAVGR